MEKNEEIKGTLEQIGECEKKEEQKKEKTFYKEWLFWVIIGIVFFSLILNFTIPKNTKTYKTSSNTSNTTSNTNSSITNKTKANPYKLQNEYDGLYKFILNSDNGSGHTFTSKGVIVFDNGTCKAKYSINSDTITEYSREYNGFCGINEEDSKFYFSLNDNEKVYQCTKTDQGFSCELNSEYDLAGCSSKELVLTYVEDSQDIDKVLAQVKEEEKVKKEEQFKESCQTYTFEQMARNPNNFKGTNVKVVGEVVQVMSDSNSTNLRVNITKTGTYTTYYTDTIYVAYQPEAGEDKILEGDIITIYGTSQGDCSYTTVLGATVTLPNIDAKYITINK